MAHDVTRRDFIKLSTVGMATAVLAGCQVPRRWVTLEPFVRPPEEQLAGVATWYASTCRQCPAGCGIVVRVMNGRAVKIEGNAEHPINRGKLCARGQAGLEVLYNPDRLRGPVRQVKRGSRQFQPLAWEEGINVLYEKLQAAGKSVAVWGGSTMSGHLYDLFQRLTAAIGAPAPLVYDLYAEMHGYHALSTSELFGTGGLPSFELSRADVVFSFGADFLGTWLNAVRYGNEFGHFRSQPLGKRGYLVQLEPRMSITGAKADRWLPIRPSSEATVAQAIVRIIADQALGPADRIERARALAGDVDVQSAAVASDIPVGELERLAHVFAGAEHAVAIPGSALTGQGNAMEAIAAVQALNTISGTTSMNFSSQSSPPAVVNPPAASFADVQALIQQMKSGDVQVLLVHSANPAYDLSPQAGFLDAVSHVPFVVSFSSIVDETAVQADLILPDRTYLESWGYAMASPDFGMPVVSSQQPVVMPVFDARSTGDVLLTVARGIPAAAQAMPWQDEVAFLKDAVGKLPAGAAGGSGSEVLWSRFLQHGGWWPAATLASARSQKPQTPIQLSPVQFQGDEKEYPYFLHLYMNELLGDGRGANQTWLQGSPASMTTISWQTWVELNPATAEKLGVQEGDVVRVTSPYGELEAPVYVYPGIRPDTIAIPLGQGHTDYGRYARDRGANPMRLVGAQTDRVSGGLTWATLRVKVMRTGKKKAIAKFESNELTEQIVQMTRPQP